MPWKETDRVSERAEFCRLAEDGEIPMRELCGRFGISPPTGYKWLARWRAEGHEGLKDRSRRPHRSPNRTPPEIEAEVLRVRRRHPAWGGRKIAAHLERNGMVDPPHPSTITGILRRHGLLSQDSGPRDFQRFEHPRPNDLWQMDFKGHFPLEAGGRCHPFGTLDDHSRFNLALVACTDQQTPTVRGILEATFSRFGLPDAYLCDNGSPWGNDQGQPWTPLGVWLCDLGIRVVHSRPFHPQTLGKQERFHQTVHREVLSGRPRWENQQVVQEAFDRFRWTYNFERPHEALEMAVPADRYRPSERSLPARIEEPDYPPEAALRRVHDGGRISYQSRRLRVGKAFIGRTVGVLPTTEDGVIEVRYRHQVIRTIDLRERSNA